MNVFLLLILYLLSCVYQESFSKKTYSRSAIHCPQITKRVAENDLAKIQQSWVLCLLAPSAPSAPSGSAGF